MSRCDCSWCHNGHKDFCQGGVDVQDFEDTPVRYKKPSRKKAEKKPRGCPGNDFGPHIYVWTPENKNIWIWNNNEEFFKTHGYYKRESKTCCGCGKVTNYRYTKKFQKRINKLGWREATYGD